MICYFDTSALVKLFSTESGSEKVKELIDNPENEVWVLELALVELLCAVFRKYRNLEIKEEDLEKILIAIENQFMLFNIVPLAGDIIKETMQMIIRYGKDYGLRTLDAMHIAGWILVTEPSWFFVSSDINQLKVLNLMKSNTIAI